MRASHQVYIHDSLVRTLKDRLTDSGRPGDGLFNEFAKGFIFF